MSDDFGQGDSGLATGGGLPYGYDNAAAHLRTADAQRPVPHENPDHRAAQRLLPRVAGAIVLILFLAWVARVIWLG